MMHYVYLMFDRQFVVTALAAVAAFATILTLAFPLLASPALYMAAGFIAGFSSAFVGCLTTLFYVQAVPDRFRGRIAGLVGALEAAVYALGVTAGGLAIDLAGSGTTIACVGLLQLTIGASCLLSPRTSWTHDQTNR